jgi:hypothetical protein
MYLKPYLTTVFDLSNYNTKEWPTPPTQDTQKLQGIFHRSALLTNLQISEDLWRLQTTNKNA